MKAEGINQLVSRIYLFREEHAIRRSGILKSSVSHYIYIYG